jgi:hypothetical protein
MLRTKSGLPKNCVWAMDRENGKRRVRFRNRKAGFSTYLTGTPWSDVFMRQYAAAVEGSKARTGSHEMHAGGLGKRCDTGEYQFCI